MSEPGDLVIVVDDDEAVRNSLKFSLELEGLSVRLYRGGADLLAELDLPRNGCLVVDYTMPGMNGIELVRRLRQRHADYPAILITSRATEDLRRRAGRSGIPQVLEKPLEDGHLLDSIQAVLAGTRLSP